MRILRYVTIALLAALLAGGVGFYGYKKGTDHTPSVNTSKIEVSAVLPDIYAYMNGRKVNRMAGYIENNASSAGRGDLTILPEDRNLQILITEQGHDISGIWYEIRDLSGENFIERTTIEHWTKTDEGITAVLPIENLIEQGEQYRLTICISSADYPAVYYYCRIIDNSKISEYLYGMIDLAEEFSEKVYRYNDARDLTTYLESNSTADNSSLGHITLENSYNQLTYNNSKLNRRGEPDLHIKEALGSMAVVSLDSLAIKVNDHNMEELFDISESFTMRQGPERIYMMSYDRYMNQIFTGNQGTFSLKNALLGVSDTNGLETISDETKAYTAWVDNGSLWCLESASNTAYEVYNARNSSRDFDARQCSIHILRIHDNGDLDFTVKGYMNNGKHEGLTGTALYHFNCSDESVAEQLFINGYASSDEIIKEETAFSYLNSTGLFYNCSDGNFLSVTPEGETSVIVQNPMRIFSSQNHELAAWQKDDHEISVMDLETGEISSRKAGTDKSLKLIGFVGTDLVYGQISQGITPYKVGSKTILPMDRILIENVAGEQEACYEKTGLSLVDAYIDRSRVHIKRAYFNGSSYEDESEDTLICNDELSETSLANITSANDSTWGKLYYASFGQECKKTVKVASTDKLASDAADVVIDAPENKNAYLSYANGRFAGRFNDFNNALLAAYDGMGIVTDTNNRIIWARPDRRDMITIRDLAGLTPQITDYLSQFDHGLSVASDGTLLLDCTGLSLNQVLYFVSKGMPVVVYQANGSYGFIYGYDTFNISICWYPGTEYEYTEKMGLQDSAAAFEKNGGNRFVAFLR